MAHTNKTTPHQPSPWHKQWAGRVCTPEDMVRFVDSVGCCMSMELPGYPNFPYQSAVIGDVEPDVPHPWFWKDDLHIEKRVYYTRVFGGKPCFISYAMLPAFMATNGAVFDELVFNGVLTPEHRLIYSIIEASGPIPIKDLKRQLTPGAKAAADRILHDFDRQFIITKTGITGRTMGTYGYIWDLVERWVPDMFTAADHLGRDKAEAMIRSHLTQYGISQDSAFYTKLLGWTG
ncbi:hypothetical protein LLG46_10435 [bacterium]|nr:hypothetical protein [bacterium]